jgi:hypothetical protein
MPPIQEARLRCALACRAHVTLVLGWLFLIAMLAQVEPQLPGPDPSPPPSPEEMVCDECDDLITPVYPKDGSGPKCPNGADHKLRSR